MALAAGTRLGPYEITNAIGAGGMGEVYRARDTRLDRAVAVKVLPSKYASDPHFRERFDREARAISALDHPHICTLYDVGEHDGTSFLVMQYFEGETLARRLERGSIPIPEAMTIGVQIADALDKAHRAGLTHRDLKPGNVMLTKSGAKLLDFGLAKLTAERAGGGDGAGMSAVPTLSTPLTAHGTIVGTFQYMAPEQLEGKATDARSDIFAFGALLYETVTGRRAFEGKSQASLIGAILKDEPPPIASLQPLAPPTLDRLIKKCLAKDPDDRWQTAHDLLDELKWTSAASSQAGVLSTATQSAHLSGVGSPVLTVPKTRPYGWIAASAFLLLTTVGLASAIYLRRPAVYTDVYRSTFVPPGDGVGPVFGRVALSPDGRRLAFSAQDAGGRVMLWMRALDSTTAQPVAGTEGGLFPFWSPNSRYIGFFADGKLKKIDPSRGPPLTICDGTLGPGTWSRDDVILFTPSAGSPISRVSAAGGTPAAVTKVDADAGESGHYLPHFLPDGRHFFYGAAGRTLGSLRLYLSSLDSSERKHILDGSSNVAYARGFLIFPRGDTLMAQPFDAEKLTLNGEAIPLAEQVQSDSLTMSATFAVSEAGVLAFQTGRSTGSSRLIWFDRTGKRLGVLGEPARYGSEVHLSPDGSRAAVVAADSGTTRDIWIFDVKRGLPTKFTFDPPDEREPIWSPDGSHIVYHSTRSGSGDLYQKASSGAGREEVLLKDSLTKLPESWSPDGKFLLFFAAGPNPQGNANDLWVLPVAGDKKPYPFLQSPTFVEYRSQFSPDGRWVAYGSNESGRFEVYVTSFPDQEGKWRVSTAGGTDPRWRRDGKEIFYVTEKQMMAAAVTATGAGFEVGGVRPLFDVPPLPTDQGRAVYDVTADGQRFLINAIEEQTRVAPITVVVNWPALLRK